MEKTQDTTIKLKKTTKDRLSSHGKKGDTYDFILIDLLDKIEKLTQG